MEGYAKIILLDQYGKVINATLFTTDGSLTF